jgi:hypothetical protein
MKSIPHRQLYGYLLLLIVSCLIIICAGCGVAVRGLQEGAILVKNSEIFHQGRHGALTAQEQEWAKAAWKYFENNVGPTTGLVNSVDKFPMATMWHVGDYLAAMVAARELNIIQDNEFDQRLSTVLHFLNTMPLYLGKVPHKSYHVEHGQMVDYGANPGEIGWSAVDIGRMLVWLRILRERYPRYAEYIDRAVLRWDFCDVIDGDGALYGGISDNGQLRKYEERRSGYQNYMTLGFQAWGWSTARASRREPYDTERIFDIAVVPEARDPQDRGTSDNPPPVVTLPYVLDGLEFNWDTVTDGWSLDSVHSDTERSDLAQRIYTVQERRYQEKKIFTARTDHQISTAPYFVYDTIFAEGYPWNTMSDSGQFMPQSALVSSRAAFGLWALWKTSYTDSLLEIVSSLFNPGKGWYEGRFELTGGYEYLVTATTNAVVLESLLYKVVGKLYRLAAKDGYYQVIINDEFTHPGKCMPLDPMLKPNLKAEIASLPARK